MLRQSSIITLLLALALSLGAAAVCPADAIIQAIGIFYGAAMALGGLVMICRLCSNLARPGRKVRFLSGAGYSLRYGMYAVLLFLGAWAGLPAIAMLAGILAQKASLLVYSFMHRKDRA